MAMDTVVTLSKIGVLFSNILFLWGEIWYVDSAVVFPHPSEGDILGGNRLGAARWFSAKGRSPPSTIRLRVQVELAT